MNNRMRDLEQIQERDPEESGRRLGTMVMAGLTLVGLSSAMGVVVGRAAQPGPEEATDPLAAIDFGQAAGDAADDDDRSQDAKVEATDLTFPATLAEKDERPEVIAALEAAEREAAMLAGDGDVQPPQAEPAAEPVAQGQPRGEMAHTLPAAIAAGSASRQRPGAANNDPLIAQASPQTTPGPIARRGEEGEYTLQVISYDKPEPANAFAERLRAKGHQAFVSRAEIEDRGVYFRVRIGPFEKRHQAVAYRRTFESQEGMNTYVVRRPKEDAS